MPVWAINLLFNKWTWIVLAFALLTGYAGYQKHRADKTEKDYEAFRISTAALGLAAQEKAKATEKKQTEATKEVRRVSKDERERISSYYGLRLPSARGGSVPAPTDNPKGADGPAAERGSGGESPSVLSCALDAQQVMAFQDWARKQGIPVE